MDDEHIYEEIDDDSSGQLMPHQASVGGGMLLDYRVSPVNFERSRVKQHLNNKPESPKGRKPGKEKRKPKQKTRKESPDDAQVGKNVSKTIASGLKKGLYFATIPKGNTYSNKITQAKPDSPQRPQRSGKEIKSLELSLKGEDLCDMDSGGESPPPPLPSRGYLFDSSFTTELKTIATEKLAIDNGEEAPLEEEEEEDKDYTPMAPLDLYEGFDTELEGVRRSSTDGNITTLSDEEDEYVGPSIPERDYTSQHDKEVVADSIQLLDKDLDSILKRKHLASIPGRSYSNDTTSIPGRSNLVSIPGRSKNDDLISRSYGAEPIASEAATYDNVTVQQDVPSIPERSYQDAATYDNVAFQEQNTPVPAIPERSYKDAEATYDNVAFQEQDVAVPTIPERSYKATPDQHIPMVPTRSYKAPANVTTAHQHLPPRKCKVKANYDNVVLPERNVPVMPQSSYKAGAGYNHNNKLGHYDNAPEPTTAGPYSNTETTLPEEGENDMPHIPERNYKAELTPVVGPFSNTTTFPEQDENYVPLIPNRNYEAEPTAAAATYDNTVTLLEQDVPLIPERFYKNFASVLNEVVSVAATREPGEEYTPPPIPERHYVIEEGEEEYMNQRDAPVIPTRTIKRCGGERGSGSRDDESDEYYYVQTGARYTLGGRHARTHKERWGHRK